MGIFLREANSNSRLSCFIRGLHTLENNKNLEATPLGFHYSLVLGPPDETLKLRFELLRPNWTENKVFTVYQKSQNAETH